MQHFVGGLPLSFRQYMFTVSNPSHELVTPGQYAQLVSTISQYQLIPGFLNDSIDDPWQVILKLLPLTRTTMIDVTLPYLKYQSGQLMNETKVLVRYILFKQQVVGVKEHKDKNLNKGQPQKQRNEQESIKTIKVPQKIRNYYVQHNIPNYSEEVPVGDLYVTTGKFKIALLFQSQIKAESEIVPFIKLGCQIISIVNDQEYDYDYFVLNYSNGDVGKNIRENYSPLVNRIREICSYNSIVLLYGGCRTCPSLGKLYFSRSFIQHPYVTNQGNQVISASQMIQTEEVEFFPLVDQSQKLDFARQPQLNLNCTNVSQLIQLGINRLNRHNSVLNQSNFQAKSLNISSKELDLTRFDFRPISSQNKDKLIEIHHKLEQYPTTKIHKRLFCSFQINGKSLIRCMYVFNMMNLFIFSKPKKQRTPWMIGVPFTKKGKNLFDIIVFIYDKWKIFQTQYPHLEESFKLDDIVRIYKYSDTQDNFSDCSLEERFLQEVSGSNQQCKILALEQIIKSNECSDLKSLALCSEDPDEKKKFKMICKQNNIETVFLDVLMLCEFLLPLQITSMYGKQIESVLTLEQSSNILEKYNPKLRNIQKQQKYGQTPSKRMLFPPSFLKLRQEVAKKDFRTINEALKFIFIQKRFAIGEGEKDLLEELILNELGSKYRSNIKVLNQINQFFITNSDDDVMRKVAQKCLQLLNWQKNPLPNDSLPQFLEDLEVVQIMEAEFENGHSNTKQEDLHKSEEQQYNARLMKCKNIKKAKRRNLISKCHQCLNQMNHRLLQKCSTCREYMCLSCIQEISGLRGKKGSKQLSRFCSVCNQTCECQKCKRKILKITQASKDSHQQNQLFQEIKLSEGVGLSQQIKKGSAQQEVLPLSQADKQNKLINGSSVIHNLLESFSDQKEQPKYRITSCQTCELLNVGMNRSITLECVSCGFQECYSCVQNRYKRVNFKPVSKKWFYKNWKCENCDKQWCQFLKIKEEQQQRVKVKKQSEEKHNNTQMVCQNQQNVPRFGNENMLTQSTNNFQNDVMDFESISDYQSSKQIGQGDLIGVSIKNSAEEKKTKEQSQNIRSNIEIIEKADRQNSKIPDKRKQAAKDQSFGSPPVVIIPEVFPPPPPTIKIRSEDVPIKKIVQIRDKKTQERKINDKKSRKNSSDSGYQSERKQNEEKSKQAEKIIDWSNIKQKGKAMWGKKSKGNRQESQSSENSSAQFSFKHDGEIRKNGESPEIPDSEGQAEINIIIQRHKSKTEENKSNTKVHKRVSKDRYSRRAHDHRHGSRSRSSSYSSSSSSSSASSSSSNSRYSRRTSRSKDNRRSRSKGIRIVEERRRRSRSQSRKRSSKSYDRRDKSKSRDRKQRGKRDRSSSSNERRKSRSKSRRKTPQSRKRDQIINWSKPYYPNTYQNNHPDSRREYEHGKGQSGSSNNYNRQSASHRYEQRRSYDERSREQSYSLTGKIPESPNGISVNYQERQARENKRQDQQQSEFLFVQRKHDQPDQQIDY